MGMFLEIEGTKEEIVKLSKLFNLDFNQHILKHYGDLWKEYYKYHGISKKDIIF
jgi:hypothetical protein